MRTRVALAAVWVMACVGCATQEDLANVERRLRTVDSRTQQMDTQLRRLADLSKEVATLKTELAAVKQRAASADSTATTALNNSKQAAGLAADIDAVKAYFKQVSDKVRSMRDDIVRILDEQNLRIDEGRKEYLKVLEHQKKVLEATQVELDNAIKVLAPKPPPAEKGVSDAPPPPKMK